MNSLPDYQAAADDVECDTCGRWGHRVGPQQIAICDSCDLVVAECTCEEEEEESDVEREGGDESGQEV